MEKIIVVYFEDSFHNTETIKIPIVASDEDSFEVEAEDTATEWYYDIASTLFSQIWRERGGSDIDYEYSNAFDAYLSNCTMTWKILEDN